MRKWRCHKLESNKRIGLWVWASASGQGKCCACARNPGSSLDPLDSGLRLGRPALRAGDFLESAAAQLEAFVSTEVAGSSGCEKMRGILRITANGGIPL